MTVPFEPASTGDIAQLIIDYPLAWVVTRDFQATPLPLIAETAADGSVKSLVGHFARRNPQVQTLMSDPEVLILFQGPHAYVSPRRVSRPAWGPTWNYAVVRLQARLTFLPEETDVAVRRLAAQLERDQSSAGGPWHVEEMGARYAQLREHIIAFRAQITATRATFKLGQDEDERSFAEIAQSFAGTPLAVYMSAQRAVKAPDVG